MTTPRSNFLLSCLARGLLVLSAVWIPVAHAQAPAQLPLLTKSGTGVSPNIMLTLDDSGSLAFRHMPEDVFAGDTFVTPNPVNSQTVRWDQSDTYQNGVNFVGTVPGIGSSTNFVLRALRSPDTNTIYYNPENRYQPWLNDDGVTRRPNAPVNAAYLSPPLKATTATTITSLTIATGSKVLVLAQTGKAFTVGQTVVLSSTATATNWMVGSISAFNAGTGAMTVSVTSTSGSGTFASWNVVQPGPTNAIIDLTNIIPTGTFTAGSFIVGQQYKIVTTGTTSFISIGSANNSVGTVFTATGVGSGTGTASGTGSVGIGSTSTANRWCFSLAANTSGTGTASGGGCQAATGPFNHDPGVYFRLSKVNPTVTAGSFVVGTSYTILTAGTTSFTAIGAANNLVGTVFTATGAGTGTGTASGPAVYSAITDYTKYTAYSINAAPATTYTKYANRTDCAGAVCTRDEERQNFANWYTYYRDRNLMARGSVMEAFGPATQTLTAGSFVVGAKYSIVSPGTTLFTAIGAANNNVGTVFTATGVGTGTGTASGGTFRLGFGRINKGSGTVDGVSTSVIESDVATYGGGGVRDYNATRRINLFKWLEDLPASNSTPLVEALNADGAYYSRTDQQGPWTNDPSLTTNTVANNATCRRSYTILTTDGYWNGPGVSVGNADNTDGSLINGVGTSYTYHATKPYSDGTSNTLADVAMYYWKRDLQPGTVNAVPPSGDNISFWQNMTTFTVGLGVRGTLNPAKDLPALTAGTKSWPAAGSGQTAANVDDLWHAAVNSRGQYFSAKDPQVLAASVQAALAGASGGSGTTAGVATASTVLSASNRKYVPTFASVTWNGDITANPLDALGQVTAAVWNAAARMPTWSARNIVTWDSGLATPAGVSFKWASMSAPNQTALGTVAATYTTQFIDFLWGDHSQEGVGFPFRTRLNASGAPFILGDFVNGNPVFVLDGFDGQYENLGLGGSGGVGYDPNYADFKTLKKNRTAVLFAGSNDGMLHGFKDTKTGISTDGQEVFAYVPRTVYSNLYKLTDKTYGETGPLQHQYFVDGPLREADAYVKGPGDNYASWRNYLVGTLGAGGRAVFALDVTFLNALGPTSVRWEISDANDADIGYILAPVKVGVLPNGRWVAVFGNGYSSTNGYATLFVVDIEDAASSNAATRAAAIQKLTVENLTGANGLGGVTLVHDANGKVTSIYAGDLKGSLWKFDYTGLGGVNFAVSGSSALFTATDGLGNLQPITSSPAVWNHAQGGQIVVFGTGRLFVTGDSADTSVQTTYAVWNKPSDALPHPLNRTQLAARSLTSFAGTGGASGTTFYSLSGTAVDWVAQRGWYIDLATPLPGGRVIYPTQVSGYDTAFVSAVAPVQGTPGVCDSLSGKGVNLLLPVQSGLNPITHQFDTDGSGVSNAGDTFAVGYGTAADGIDAVVHNQGIGIDDKGGGGGEGDCNGASCSAAGHECVPSPLCPEETINGEVHKRCLASVQSATAGMISCIDLGVPPVPPAAPPRTFDRVWRRIINPPIQ